jgi:hypothetical protein
MAEINIPFASTFTSAGTGSLEILRTETFTWGEPDVIFDASMNVDVFKGAFKLAEDPIDSSANLALDLDPSGEKSFKDALVLALAAEQGHATLTTAGLDLGYDRPLVVNESSLEDYLLSFAQDQLDEDLLHNNMPAALEAEHMTDLSLNDFAEDCSAAVAALWADMDMSENDAKRKLIALQFSSARYLEQHNEAAAAAVPVLDATGNQKWVDADGAPVSGSTVGAIELKTLYKLDASNNAMYLLEGAEVSSEVAMQVVVANGAALLEPVSTINGAVMAKDENFKPSLPAKAGDTIIFRFIINQEYTISHIDAAETGLPADAVTGASAAVAVAAAAANNSYYGVNPRIVHVKFTLV